jgi:hypothetical protein
MKESGISAQKLAMCCILSIPNPFVIFELKAAITWQKARSPSGTSDADNPLQTPAGRPFPVAS